MDNDPKLDTAFAALRGPGSPDLPQEFMDGVWMHAGRMSHVADARRRLALFAAIFATGMSAGFLTVQSPAQAREGAYELVPGTDLSPAALLIAGS